MDTTYLLPGGIRPELDCERDGAGDGVDSGHQSRVYNPATDNAPTTLLKVAMDLAEAAAELIRTKRGELGDVRAYSQSKSSAEDPVTIVDSMAEEFITEGLRSLRPRDGLIGEEGSSFSSVSGVTWIVDPIDGTVNFIYGHPNYAVSIAAAVDGEVIAGCVVNVATAKMYVAAKGCGAFALSPVGTHSRLVASQEVDLATTLVATGFSYASLRRKAQAEILLKVLPLVRDIRRMGSAALDLCALAEGMVDAYYEHALNAWDYAAGVLIAREAGAFVVAPALSQSGDDAHLLWGCAPGLKESFRQVMGDIPQELPLAALSVEEG